LRYSALTRTARNYEDEMIGNQSTDDVLARWLADKEAKRDAVLKALDKETDPKKQRSLRARAERFQAMIAGGTSDAPSRAASYRAG
jgi:hypothetical protein